MLLRVLLFDLTGCAVLHLLSVTQNNRERRAELYIRWAGITTFVTGIVFAVFWNVFYTFDEQGICDISPKCTYSE